MAGLVPAIPCFVMLAKAWMPGIKPGMTVERVVSSRQPEIRTQSERCTVSTR